MFPYLTGVLFWFPPGTDLHVIQYPLRKPLCGSSSVRPVTRLIVRNVQIRFQKETAEISEKFGFPPSSRNHGLFLVVSFCVQTCHGHVIASYDVPVQFHQGYVVVFGGNLVVGVGDHSFNGEILGFGVVAVAGYVQVSYSHEFGSSPETKDNDIKL